MLFSPHHLALAWTHSLLKWILKQRTICSIEFLALARKLYPWAWQGINAAAEGLLLRSTIVTRTWNMKAVIILVSTYSLIVVSNALPFGLHEWYRNGPLSEQKSLTSGDETNIHPSFPVKFRKTRRHSNLDDELDTYQLFEQNLFLGASRIEWRWLEM